MLSTIFALTIFTTQGVISVADPVYPPKTMSPVVFIDCSPDVAKCYDAKVVVSNDCRLVLFDGKTYEITTMELIENQRIYLKN